MDHYRYWRSLADMVGLVAFDVGARNGVNEDLLPLSNAVVQYGFEPDPVECSRLNADKGSTWKSLTFLPTALGSREESFDLNIYKQQGCSSKLHARQDIGKLFSRSDYYDRESVVSVPAKRLDDVVKEFQISSPAFMKIDVQGMENEVFDGAQMVLNDSLVGIRTEVSLIPMYRDQPLFSDIDQILRPYGFVPMRWIELHEWRRTTKKKFPELGPDPMPYSRGQIIHGDVLYLLHPEGLPSETDEQIKRLVRLALIAICYEHFDHALAVFERPHVLEYCKKHTGKSPVEELHLLSTEMAKHYQGGHAVVRKMFHRFYEK